MHDTGPPRIPVPGDAPCADASITAPTDDSTDALHTAAADVPEGILNDSVDVSTTVVGGMDETEGLSEGVTDVDALIVVLSLDDELIDADTVLEREADSDTVIETDGDEDDVEDGDVLADDDALSLDDTLDDGDVE